MSRLDAAKAAAGAFLDTVPESTMWLPLLCTMNVTVATEMVREDFGLDHKKFEAAAGKAPNSPSVP